MEKYVIVKCCEDGDGGTYSDCLPVLYDTREEAEQGVENAIKEELEALGENYEISDYNGWEIVDCYESRVSTYDVFAVDLALQSKDYIYPIFDLYTDNCILGELVFNHPLKQQEKDSINRKIEEIKENLIEQNAGDWQTYEVIEELHKYFDFVDIDVQSAFYL